MTEQNILKRFCLKGISVKEDGTVTGLLATTHPDRIGDILSKNALSQIAAAINNESTAGDQQGSYRSVSLFHDWVNEQDPTKDEAAFIVPGSARIVELDGSHFGVEATARINDFYKGTMTPEEIKYRISNGAIAGFSIEYVPGETRAVTLHGRNYRFINTLEQYAGQGFARSRVIANPHAIIYKEIETYIKEQPEEKISVVAVTNEELESPAQQTETKETSQTENSVSAPVEAKETPSTTLSLSIKEVLESKEFKEAVQEEITVKSRTLKVPKEDGRMEQPIQIKEMNAALRRKDPYEGRSFDVVAYKEAVTAYFKENPIYEKQMQGHGIPLTPTIEVKADGSNKLRVVSNIEVKGTLDTSTNASTYTQNIAEFADLYIPVLVDVFNNQTNLFGELRKVPHLMGGDKYGWNITQDQSTGLSVDPDNAAVTKSPVTKLKLQTDIKVYRVGVSVNDYVLHHARATWGDLLMIEVEKRMKDMMRDINNDLFTEQTDSTTKVIGLEAVADSAGNTTLYGLTRSSANRLSPSTAADTYAVTGTTITSATLRLAMRKPEVDGALRGNLRLVSNPVQRDQVFEIEDGNLRYYDNKASLGFNGQIAYDGVPWIIDSSCPTDSIFVVDFESYYIVISKAPTLTGLARVSAATEAYVEVYLAAVYERPRRIYQLDTLS